MHRIVLLALGLVMVVDAGSCALGQSPPQAGSRRRALLVGCTDYPSLEKSMWLQGPANDVVLMREMLIKNFEFPAESIVTLAEGGDEAHRPTRANIERQFKRLAEEARANDQIVILLSGHGSQVPDEPPFDESDGFDEAFLPADIGPWDRNKQKILNAVVDDDLNAWLGAICEKEALLWFIADSCHSGTLIRGHGDEVDRKVPTEALLVPPEVMKAAEERPRKAAGEAPRGPLVENPGGEVLTDDMNPLRGLVALYASQPNEPTVEDKLPDPQSPYHGLLTFTMIQTLKEARTKLTYRQLSRRIYSNYIGRGRLTPTPLLDGRDQDRDRYVLGIERAPAPARYQLVRNVRGRWTVDAGALHGLTVGSILEVAAEAGDLEPDRVLGHVRVAEGGLRPLSSRVEPCQPDGKPARLDLPSPGQCRVVFLDYGDQRVRVAVDKFIGDEALSKQKAPPKELPEAGRARLAAVLREIAGRENEGERLITPEDDPNRAEWLLRATTAEADNVELIPTTGWAKARGAALPSALGPLPVKGTSLKERLVRIARTQNLLKVAATQTETLRGPGDSSIDLKVEMLRLADEEDRQGEVIPQEPNLTFRVGDLVAFRVENRGQSAVDVTLLSVDGDYNITAVFPDPNRPGMDNRLVPVSRGGRPLVKPFEITEEAMGREHLIAIAVEPQRGVEPINFSFLAERTFTDVEKSIGTRGGPGATDALDSPLGKLLQSAVFARGLSRGARLIEARSYSIQDLSWRSQGRTKDEETKSPTP